MSELILVLSSERNAEKHSDPINGLNLSYLGYKSYKTFQCFYYRSISKITFDYKVKIRAKLAPLQMDVLFIPDFLDPTKPALFVFDMDSTLIKQEVIDEIARENGVYEEVALVTKEAMQGNLSFDEALRKRCALLEGISTECYDAIFQKLELNEGVEFFFDTIQSFSAKVAVLSGGFVPILEKFAQKYKVDEFRANILEEKSGRLTGQVLGEIVNSEKKAFHLNAIAQKNGIPKSQIVAVGDGANDAKMILSAGIGIGFHAKEGLKNQITNWVDYFGMETLFFCFEPEFLNR